MESVCAVVLDNGNVSELIGELKALGAGGIIVVSADEHEDHPGVTFLREVKPGYGRAFKTGFLAVPASFEYVAAVEPGYDVSVLPALMPMFCSLDFVSCARDLAGMKRSLRLGNFLLTLSGNALFGGSFSDSQSGMWVFRRQMLSEMMLFSDGREFAQEMRYTAVRKGFRVGEVSLEMCPHVSGISEGISRMRGLFRLRFDSGISL